MRIEKGFIVDGDKLTASRIESGLSLDEVAGKMGCNKGNISRWERGKVSPNPVFILQLILIYKRFDFVRMAATTTLSGNLNQMTNRQSQTLNGLVAQLCEFYIQRR